ncbi:hypothetical protein HCN44_007028 [Aphidius gifuensis]|uniref:Bee-milk protein n=1 Tax=Aphidius gifuensis TaxID=684658 RepID=A0A834XZV1_APHGI|nr:hypothetical protein HCN44_007028 [Aphidius gifuensis]
MRNILLMIFIIKIVEINTIKSENLETIAEWKLLDFNLPYDEEFMNNYNRNNIVPTGIEVSWNKIFIATPRLKSGVPSTISFISRNKKSNNGQKLEAYPNWSYHQAGKNNFSCTGLISVYRMRLDSCNRIWILDSGINTSIDDFQSVCPPKILIFDLKTDQLVRQINFQKDAVRLNSLFTNLIIDETDANTCDDVFVYISDTTGPGLVVLDGRNDKSWRFLHASMLPDPYAATYQIGQDIFELFDGIVGLAFSPRQRKLYYQPLATDRLFSVSTSSLKSGPPGFNEQLPVELVGRKSSQGLGIAVDPRDDTILFSPLTETAIATWNPHTAHHRIIAYSPIALQFVAEVRWIDRDNGNTWILSSRFQKFFLQNVNPNDINIRIMRIVQNIQYQPYYNTYNLYNNTLVK